jgi:hypothetical protein
MECAGAWDVALGRGLLIRIVQMLTRLAQRMQG